jgi:hypothetical protein
VLGLLVVTFAGHFCALESSVSLLKVINMTHEQCGVTVATQVCMTVITQSRNSFKPVCFDAFSFFVFGVGRLRAVECRDQLRHSVHPS